jgi:hypothetical protein
VVQREGHPDSGIFKLNSDNSRAPAPSAAAFDMDKMVGRDFEAGLTKLKRVVEA